MLDRAEIGDFRFVRADVAVDSEVRAAVDAAAAQLGGLDVLVDNAGIGDPAAERAALEARQPHGRLVSADAVAHAVAYLASPRAGSTTGIELAVDGGMAGLRLRPRT